MIKQIASLANLRAALNHCRSGKRESQGYQKFLLHLPGNVLAIRDELLSNTYKWSPYRAFNVCDPKKREILAAPFRDRIVHQAIHQIIGPRIHGVIPQNSFACRPGMGNRQAALTLLAILNKLGATRFAIKLDVSRYFFSINHQILLTMLDRVLAAPPLMPLLRSLLNSHDAFAREGVGIPIGNVTSQSFANLYLSDIDRLAAAQDHLHYIRYMDDMVIVGREKGAVKDFAQEVRNYVTSHLALQIPSHKCMPLGADPIPFLGYVIDHQSYRPLRRNERRHQRRVRSLHKQQARASRIAMLQTSFTAWSRLC